MRVLVAIPDNNSDDRIQTLMLYDESNRDDDMSVGLLRYGYQTARQRSMDADESTMLGLDESESVSTRNGTDAS